LLSCIGLTHRNDLAINGTLAVDDHDHATLQQPEANGPGLTIVAPEVLELNRPPRKHTFSIKKVEASLLKGAEALEGIKADHRVAAMGRRPGRALKGGWA
jgi:hypothetical protein